MTTINDHVLPSGLTYGQEQRRAQLVAMLHQFTPYEDGATEDSLKAEYLEIMGEPYQTQTQESSANRATGNAKRDSYYIDKYDRHRKLLADAKEVGFRNLTEIMQGLGYDTSEHSWQGSFYQAKRAGEDFVVLIPDGQGYYIDGDRKTIAKSKRWGVYMAGFDRIKAYHDEAEKLRLRQEWEWKLAEAEAARVEEGDKTELMDWVAHIAALMLDEPPMPDSSVLEAAWERKRIQAATERQEKAEERQAKAEERQEDEAQVAEIVASLPTYSGAYNKREKPKIQDLSDHVGFKVTRWQRNQAWLTYQEGLENG